MDNGITLAQAAKQLGVCVATVRRYIKRGMVDAVLVEGRFGPEYRVKIPAAMLENKPIPKPEVPTVGQLMVRLDELHMELGYWRGRAQAAEERLLLLGAPRPHWWQRLGLRNRASDTGKPPHD